MKQISIMLILVLSACSEKEETSFADFENSYFTGLQSDERTEACSQWYEDCVAAGYAEEDCSRRIEYCDEDWGSEDREEEREDDSSDCDDVSTRAYEECLQAGGSEEDCRDRAARAYEECSRAE